MDSGEDDEIAQLRSTLLHSIRASKNRSSRGRNKHQEQIFDTDIDDLEALRLAALGTVKAGASVSGNGSPSTWQQPSTPLLRSTQNAQFPVAPPQYRPRFPFNNRLKLTAPRSNLIVLTHTEPKKESYNHNSNHLALPQQRLNGAPANRMLNESPAKRTDKWSRNRDSSDDDSDGEDEEEGNGKEGSGSEDGDREERSGSASSASDGLQAAAEDDDTSRPALADGELIDIPDTVEDDDEGTASAAAPVKKS
uniref:Uncharacterized protein n=1 Tax=Plectus sambesii TaxID=2011161 RepID=A0A914WAJ0_9BILA